MRGRARAFFSAAVVLTCLSLSSAARSDSSDSSSDSGHPYTHYIAAFGGLTMVHHTNHGTVAAQYEKRTAFMDGKLGFGPTAQLITAPQERAFSTTLLFYYHPFLASKIFWGPGYEVFNGKREVLIRCGLGYDVFAGHVAVSPQIAVDLAGDDTSFSAGLSLGLTL